MKNWSLFAGDVRYSLSVIMITIVLFLIHFLWGSERFFRNRVSPHLKMNDHINNQAFGIFYKRLTALLLWGFIPLIVAKGLYRQGVRSYGLSFGYGRLPFFFITPVLIMTFLTMFCFSRKKNIYLRYPEVEGAFISRIYFIISSLTYVLYLFGYECLFRGFLLFGLRKSLGDLPSVLVSMGFVTLTHMGTNFAVIIGAMVSGFIFPYIALLSGSLWPVLLLHVTIGVGMDWLCIRYRMRCLGSAEHASPQVRISVAEK
jgi:membrane protease YdiL (CAAX protease family)